MSNNLGTKIREAREARGYSIKKFSQISGICRNQIVNIEIGRTKKPQYKTLQTLAKCLKLDFPELLKQGGYCEEEGIQQIRINHGWSVEELGERSGISIYTIGRMERKCPVKPKSETLQALAKALEIDYMELLKRFGYIQDEDSPFILGQKVSQARYLKGLSKKELGKLAGISRQQINNIENGITKKSSRYTLLKIGEVLDIELV